MTARAASDCPPCADTTEDVQALVLDRQAAVDVDGLTDKLQVTPGNDENSHNEVLERPVRSHFSSTNTHIITAARFQVTSFAMLSDLDAGNHATSPAI